MFDYGFPIPLTEEDRKASAPYFYTVAAIAGIIFAGFAGYELGLDKGMKEGRKEAITRVQTVKTNSLEKITNNHF